MPVSSGHSKPTLYDISLEGMIIQDILIENEGELTPELEARIDELMRQAPDRIEAAAMVLRHIEADAEACDKEARRLAERKKSFETQAKRLKDRMVIAVDAAFGGKVKTPRFTIWTQKSAESISIALAAEYNIEQFEQDRPDLVKTEKSVDTSAVRRLIDSKRTALDTASAVLADPEATEEDKVFAKETLALIPEGLDVEFKPGTRYLRVK